MQMNWICRRENLFSLPIRGWALKQDSCIFYLVWSILQTIYTSLRKWYSFGRIAGFWKLNNLPSQSTQLQLAETSDTAFSHVLNSIHLELTEKRMKSQHPPPSLFDMDLLMTLPVSRELACEGVDVARGVSSPSGSQERKSTQVFSPLLQNVGLIGEKGDSKSAGAGRTRGSDKNKFRLVPVSR